MNYRVEIRGREGCIVLSDWEPAGRQARHATDVFDSVEDAIAFARERIAPNCDYELQVIGDDGKVLYTRRQASGRVTSHVAMRGSASVRWTLALIALAQSCMPVAW
jgi:hypothetical protein